MLLEHTNAILKFNEDGGCSLFVSPGNMGQGILGTLAQIAAEVLGLDYEDINVIYGDTDLTAFDIGTHASRGVYCIGRAVKKGGRAGTRGNPRTSFRDSGCSRWISWK